MKNLGLFIFISCQFFSCQFLHAKTYEESIKERTKELEQISVVLSELTNQTPIENAKGVKLRCLKKKETERLWKWDVETALERERFYPYAVEFENHTCVDEEGFQSIIKGSQHKIAELKQLQKLPEDLSKKSKQELRDQIKALKKEIEDTTAQIGREISQENRRNILVLCVALAAIIITVVYLGVPLLTYAALFTILVGVLQIGVALKEDYKSYVTQKTSLKKEMLEYSQKALDEFGKVPALKQSRRPLP